MCGILRLKCDGTRAETRFRLSAKQRSPFKSAVASVQSTNGSRGVRVSGNDAGYTMFRGSVKSTGYLLHSPVSPSLPLPCVTVCNQISTGPYMITFRTKTSFIGRGEKTVQRVLIYMGTPPPMFCNDAPQAGGKVTCKHPEK